jgi:hypothetical protein
MGLSNVRLEEPRPRAGLFVSEHPFYRFAGMTVMNNEQRAVQLWSVLALAARTQQILSYVMVERLIGVPRYGLAPILGAIEAYCGKHKLPALPSSSATMAPTSGR